MKYIVILLTLLSFSRLVHADNETPDIPVGFSAQHFTDQGQHYLALNYFNYPEWHTYWKNPGDAGLPTKFEVLSETGPVEFEELEWPAPKRFIEKGDILAFGYKGQYSFFLRLSAKIWDQLINKKISIKSTWLVCKHICIPGQAEVNGLAQNNFVMTARGGQALEQETLLERLRNLPAEATFPEELDLSLTKAQSPYGDLVLNVNWQGGVASDLLADRNLLTPFPVSAFAFKREKLYADSKNHVYGIYTIDWDGQYAEPSEELPVDGRFVKAHELKFLYANPVTQTVQVIKKSFTTFSVDGFDRILEFLNGLRPLEMSTGESSEKKIAPNSNGSEPATQQSDSLIYYLLFAFIGGLILNVMPCVLPVISLKLFELISQRDDNPLRIMSHNIAYSLGVMTTFLILAVFVVVLKQSGDSVGWGFHMQSPSFVALMVLVVFIFAFNLFGLFEFRTPGGSKLGNIKLASGFFGDFSGGILATILSTPCSAPFLGTALTFAFTSSPLTIFLIFLSVGMGLVFPFILTAFIPQLVSFLPRPGKWMEDIKKFLGLSLVLTGIWLLDVFSALVSSSISMMKLNTIIALMFFAIYFWNHIGKRIFWKILFALLPLLLTINLLAEKHDISVQAHTDLIQDKIVSQNLNWEVWSENAMAQHKQSGDWVFMDFTAKWCFTCKVNEKLVIDTDSFRELVQRKKIKLLLADWTKKDPVIEAFLKKNGYVGVPAYFIQKPNGEFISLGETISIKEIEENLD
ncbi:MAG: protein-disulfide reductase DsbD family protein [Bdellovibrio sp.]